jgi:ribose/xylose/arabinose/galactoside ABC-type transport system permease subunit
MTNAGKVFDLAKELTKKARGILSVRPEGISLILCIIMILILSIFVPRYFYNSFNLSSLVVAVAPEGIVALGMMLLLVSGVFDLSVGSVMCLGGLVASMAVTFGVPTPLAVLLGLSAGLLTGTVNGFLTEIAAVNPLITTIGMMYMVRGVTEITLVSRGKAGYTNFPQSFKNLGQGTFLGIMYMFWIMLILLVLFTIYITMRKGGRRIYFIGGNENAALAMGIRKRKIRILLFILTGVLAALAGILLNARTGSANRYIGQNSHLNIIIACIIGGGSLAGGKGNMLGAIFGTLFLALLNNAFNLFEVNQHVQSLTTGIVLLAVVVIDGYMSILKRRALGKE